MPHNPDPHRRRSICLPGYDYERAGSYYITIGTYNRENLFGEVIDCEMRLNAYGEIAGGCWEQIPAHFEGVRLDAFIVMPNHVHGVLILEAVGARHASPLRYEALPPVRPRGVPARSIGAIVGSYKSAVTRRINAARDTQDAPVWQRNYYEHIVRNEGDFERIRAYIEGNPARWHEDEYFA